MIEVKNLVKRFKTEVGYINAVDNVSLKVSKGDIFGIIGFSGAGKSTLIRCLNLLESYDSGYVEVYGKELKTLAKKELLKLRENMGMIFQSFNLLNSANVYENIAIPLRNTKRYTKEEIKERVLKFLKLVDLEDKQKSYPNELSGGQKQRVAIARALSLDCKILLCDEATSALDPKTTKSILNLLKKINKEFDVTIVLITHQMEVVKTICNKIAVMEKGKIIESGNILDIFSNPTTETTKNLVFESFHSNEVYEFLQDKKDIKNIFSIFFIGDLVEEPVLSTIQKKYNVDVNILFGNIEFILGKKLGNLIVEITGEDLDKAILEIKEKANIRRI